MKPPKLLISVLLLYAMLIGSTAYGQPSFDELYNAWKDPTKSDTLRLLAVQDIALKVYWNTNMDTALYYVQQMEDYAVESGVEYLEAAAYRWQAHLLWYQGAYEQAMENAFDGLDLYEQLEMEFFIASMNQLIGIIFSDQAEYDRALDYYDKALPIYEKLNRPGEIIGLLNNYSVIHARIGEFEASSSYLRRAVSIADSIGDERSLRVLLPNLALDLFEFKEYEEGLVFAQRGLELARKYNDQRQEGQCLGVIADYYVWIEEYREALNYRLQALEVSRKRDYKFGVADHSRLLGDLYQKLGEHNRAIEWCSRGLELFKDIGYLEGMSGSYKCLYGSYKAMNNTRLALRNHELYKDMEDSIKEENTSKKLQKLELERKFMADSLLREQEKVTMQMAFDTDLQRKENTKNLFIASGIFLFVLSLGLYNRMQFTRRAKNQIEKEKDRSESLLLNILPQEVAEELKINGKADAKDFDQVSILFTDFKSFTGIAGEMSPHELVDAINECFVAFDHICEKYSIEKIKTIGDAYMAAGGIPIPNPEAARNTVLAALEMQTFVQENKTSREQEGKRAFEMRAGVHTGAVVAGIVGVKKFQYDIWGDTVNIASRMESNGQPNQVNVSQFTYDLLKDDPTFTFAHRGKLDVKGKGEMEMYFVSKAES